jgi:hypothetical protein
MEGSILLTEMLSGVSVKEKDSEAKLSLRKRRELTAKDAKKQTQRR